MACGKSIHYKTMDGLEAHLRAVVPLAERAATRGCVGRRRRGRRLTRRFSLVLARSVRFRVHGRGLGAVATCRRRTVALAPRRSDFQCERLAGPRGYAGGDGVPPQTAVHLVEVAAHVGFGGKGFEAHWAGFSSRCAQSPSPTSSIIRNIYYYNRLFTFIHQHAYKTDLCRI